MWDVRKPESTCRGWSYMYGFV